MMMSVRIPQLHVGTDEEDVIDLVLSCRHTRSR